MTRQSFIEPLPDDPDQNELARQRRADEELRSVARHVRCLLWHGSVAGLPGWETDAMDFDRGLLKWTIEIQDESAAQQILPLDVWAGETYADAWFRSRLHDDDVQMWHNAAAALLKGKTEFSQEFRCRDRLGNLRWQHEDLSIQPIDLGQWRVFSVVTDITDRKHAEQELQRAKEVAEAASLAKDRFLAMLSHELRTPLTPVLATVNLIESRKDLADDLRADLTIIRQNVEMEARLIDDLLDLTRVNRGKVELRNETVDAHAAIQSALQTCGNDAESKHLTITLNLDATQHHVWADAARLQQVFWNLLKNAIKFTPVGGTVEVRTSNFGDDPQAKWISVEVIDNGIGIEPDVLPRLFDEFEQGERTITRQFGGLGLGLTISRSLVLMQHGTLSASSAGRNRGATFTVKLPTSTGSLAQKLNGVVAGKTEQSSNTATILLVDDHADTLRIMARLLRSVGYQIVTADCVEAAIAVAMTNKIDMLISDLGLPDGTGLDIMQALRAEPSVTGIKGIALSGFGMDEDIRKSLEAGFEKHLTKPVNFRVLAEAIREVLA
jgi:signal transduction histidine kinase/CheY-like chemotaxis protein